MSREPRRQLRILTAFLAIAGVATTLAVGLGPGPAPHPRAPENTPHPADPGQRVVRDDAPDQVAAADPLVAGLQEGVAGSVAFITTLNGTGSGVLVAEDLVVTNAHVIWPFETVEVRFPGGEPRHARVLGVDAQADLALLEVGGSGLPSRLETGAPARLSPDELLYVIGYPAGPRLDVAPTVAAASFLGAFDWGFSGVSWLAVDAPAVGGQSGGALVDQSGRLVGITTLGSSAELYAVAVDDVLRIAEALTLATNAVETRRPPRSGGSQVVEVDLEGPWQQATFVTWLTPGSAMSLASPTGVMWRALDPYGVPLAQGDGDLVVRWDLATPGILHAESASRVASEVVADVDLIPAPDGDDGRRIAFGSAVSGLVDVPGDRDWYLFDHEDGGPLTIDVESQTRMRVAIYDRTTLELLAEVVDERGFFFDDPPLVVADLAGGGYVVVVEDVAAQFGTYRIQLG